MTTWELDRAVKPIDSWWTVAAIDPVALRVLPVLLRIRRATPNVITGLAFVVGIASVASFASAHWIAGALLYELRFFLDCLDGKVARVRRLSSPVGAIFDRVADMLTIPAAYVAIGWSLARTGDVPERLVLLTAGAALLVSGLEAVLEVTRCSTDAEPVDASVPSGVIGWARRHRLTLRPWTVEAETLGLFLGPLVLRGGPLGALFLGVAGVYGAFAVVDLGLIVRTAKS